MSQVNPVTKIVEIIKSNSSSSYPDIRCLSPRDLRYAAEEIWLYFQELSGTTIPPETLEGEEEIQ